MNKFYTLVEAQWQDKAIKFILGTASGSKRNGIAIPISDKMLRRLGTVKKGRVLHGFGSKSLAYLLSIQNSKKSLSTTTNLIFGCNGGGCWANGLRMGALIEGDVLLSINQDIMSMPDKQGRRWVDATYLFDQYDKETPERELKMLRKHVIMSVLKDIGKKFKDYTSFIESEIETIDWDYLISIADMFDNIQANSKKIFNYLVSETIKRFYEGTEKILSKHIDSFTKVALVAHNAGTITDNAQDYDEVLVNNFKILDVFIPQEIFKWYTHKVRDTSHEWDDEAVSNMNDKELFRYTVSLDRMKFGGSGLLEAVDKIKVPIAVGRKEELINRYKRTLYVK